jgi:integrase
MTAERLFSTESELAVLKAIDGKDTTYTDARTPGLRVRISAKSGRKTFIFEYRRPGLRPSSASPTKQKLDNVSTLKEARKRAAEIKRALEAGQDPFAPPPPPLPPAPELVKITVAYIAEQYKAIKKPADQDWRLIEQRIIPAFGTIEVADLKAHEISKWHGGITKKVAIKDETGKTMGHTNEPAMHQADRLLDIFRAMMNWAERQQLKPRHTNPCDFVQRNFTQLDTERHYEWNDVELERLAEVLTRYEREAEAAHGSGHYMVAERRPDGTIIEHMPGLWSILALRFLIITGVRKNEALKLRWDQIKEDRNVIEWVRNSRRRETKVIGGGRRAMLRAITGPLGELLAKLKQIRVVGNPYVFVGKERVGHLTDIHRIWYRIREEAQLVKADGERPRIHDLRHCYGQAAAEAGLHEKQIMAVMGHSTTRMSARYAKYGPNAHASYAETVANHISRKLQRE